MKANLLSMCSQGYWHCDRCDRLVEIHGDPDSPTRCPHCKHATARWVPPIFNDYEKITLSPHLAGGR